MPASGFRATPRPDYEVIDLLERVLYSAREGRVRSISLVVVDPIHQAETASAGDLSQLRINVLIGGLSRAAQDLLKTTDR